MSILADMDDWFDRLLFAGRWAVRLHRLAHALHTAGLPILPGLIQALNGVLHGCEIHYKARIGPNLQIAHPRGVVVGRNVVAGRNLTLYTGVVLGVKRTGIVDQPRIGDDVTIYAGAKVLGGISVGDGATIGANAVVTEDVPAGCLVGGIPARVVRRPPEGEPGDSPEVSAPPAGLEPDAAPV